jgi:hypothetical protein
METRTPDQHDAWATAKWMRQTDLVGRLPEFFAPKLSVAHRAAAETEGWILGLR